jgi:UDP-N-acetylglucosamine:LPS N-acetylglucosamine transferase
MSKKQKAVLLICGMGGHTTQMQRLAKFLPDLSESVGQYVLISDTKNLIEPADIHITLGEIRDKDTNSPIWVVAYRVFVGLIKTLKVFSYFDVRLVISTGPGHAIAPSLIARIFRKRVLHLETWSRFETYSLAGRVMYYLATEFWVQHKSLQKLYPKSKYVGML